MHILWICSWCPDGNDDLYLLLLHYQKCERLLTTVYVHNYLFNNNLIAFEKCYINVMYYYCYYYYYYYYNCAGKLRLQ